MLRNLEHRPLSSFFAWWFCRHCWCGSRRCYCYRFCSLTHALFMSSPSKSREEGISALKQPAVVSMTLPMQLLKSASDREWAKEKSTRHCYFYRQLSDGERLRNIFLLDCGSDRLYHQSFWDHSACQWLIVINLLHTEFENLSSAWNVIHLMQSRDRRKLYRSSDAHCKPSCDPLSSYWFMRYSSLSYSWSSWKLSSGISWWIRACSQACCLGYT